MKNALDRYNNQDNNTLSQMHEPIKTVNGLYVWEVWTYKTNGTITDIRYYAEDVNGGNTMRISLDDFLKLSS